MQTDYLEFFDRIRTQIGNQPILLCSDDDAVKEKASIVFGSHKIISLRQITGFGNKPLHLLGSKVTDETKFDIVLDALTDLMAMALAKKVYIPKNTQGKLSGFGRLGKMLQADKAIVLQLLRRPIPFPLNLIRTMKRSMEWLSWPRAR